MAYSSSAAEQGTERFGYRESGGWYGWIAFGGLMMVLLGAYHAIAGLVALFQEDFFLVGQRGLVVDVSYTAWGWAHLILGLIVLFAGVALLGGAMWARIVAVVVTLISAVVNLGFLSAYPIWSTIMIALDVIVIYAVVAHGDTGVN
jgi:hypothetical protein